MSSELESDKAMVLNSSLEFKLLVLEAEPVVMPVTLSMGSCERGAKFRVDKPAVKIILQVTQICTFAA